MNEKNQVITKVRKMSFYSSLIAYWLILPILFSFYLAMKMLMMGIDFQTLLTQNLTVTVLLLIALLNPFSAYFLLNATEKDRKRNQPVGFYLKAMLVQQLLVGNLVGAVLVFFSFREMPYSQDGVDSQMKMTSVYILVGIQYILSLVAIFALWMMVKNGS
ncbi:hypothetical protein AB6884_09440 [Carnobacterium maltaromaticum]|uniref:hypothetical protein n=1 Tax=Carnobacterium maltaromaticum TaxID=2751 RepID=UPI0039BDDF0C